MKIAIHKFTSCDGCQLAFLNAGEALLDLAERIDIVHFIEAGLVDEAAEVDVAFVEGSVSTPAEAERIRGIRKRSGTVVAMGACATAGGIQALRNMAEGQLWMGAVYPQPHHIDVLEHSTPIADHVRVDLELWGCPVDTGQLLAAVGSLLAGAAPVARGEKVCLECKRRGNICTLVTRAEPCMGPVTRTGCGAICPAFGRGCYGCYGPAEAINTGSLANRFEGLGLLPDEVARRFHHINSAAPPFAREGTRWKDGGHE